MNKFSLCVSALFCSWEFRLCSSLTYFHGIIFMLFVWRQTISVYNAASSVEKLCCPQSAAWALDLTPNLLTGRRSEWRRGCRGTLPFSIWKIATSIYVAFSMFVGFRYIRQNIRTASSLTASQIQSWISTCSSALAWFAWSLASLIVRQSHDA